MIDWIERHAVPVQALTGIVTLLVAIAALLGVKAQIDASAHLQREQSARDIYREYLNLSIARPEFVRPDYCTIAGSAQEPAYETYVDYLLYTAEQTLAVAPDWEPTFARQLAAHRPYLCASEDWSDYSDAVVRLIDITRAECRTAELPACPQE